MRHRFMGKTQGKEGRCQAGGLKLCSVCCVSCRRGMSSPRSCGQLGSVGQVAASPTCSEGQASSRQRSQRFLLQYQGSCPPFIGLFHFLYSRSFLFSHFSEESKHRENPDSVQSEQNRCVTWPPH